MKNAFQEKGKITSNFGNFAHWNYLWNNSAYGTDIRTDVSSYGKVGKRIRKIL